MKEKSVQTSLAIGTMVSIGLLIGLGEQSPTPVVLKIETPPVTVTPTPVQEHHTFRLKDLRPTGIIYGGILEQTKGQYDDK